MSKKIVVHTDANGDLSPQMINEVNLKVMPMRFIINGVEYSNYPDYREYPIDKFYDEVRGGAMPSTNQGNIGDYLNALTPDLKDGNDVINLVMSSGLSGTYNSAVNATKELVQDYPNCKIATLDTKAISIGQGIIAYEVAKKAQSGASFEECVQYAEKLISKMSSVFTIDDLKHLERGGRLSKGAAIIGSLLNIKPILIVDKEGKLKPDSKARGRKKAIKQIAEVIINTYDPKINMIGIAHADDLEAAQLLESLVKAEVPTANIITTVVGPVVGSHTGAGVLAACFVAKD
jgi:DegV family protein with EDD domain